MVGMVTDPSGLLLANVAVTATSIETGQMHMVKTNASGAYVIASLPVGHYSLKAEAPGFKTGEHNGVVLNVGDRVRLDFHLQLGAVKETVTVEASSARIQTETGKSVRL